MALVKFYRGNYEKYNKTTHADGVYFASDKQLILMNGVEYGGVNMHAFEGFIKDVDVEGQTLTFKKDVIKDGVPSWENVTIKLLEAADSSIELGTIVTTEGINDGSTIKLKAVYDTDEDGDGLKLDATNGVKVVLTKTRERLATIEGEDTVDGSIKKALKDAKDYTDAEIQNLDVAKVGEEGKFIQSIKEEDGKIAAVAVDLNSTAVSRTATVSSDTKVAVSGTNVEEAIESLATSIKATEKAAATYSVRKVESGLAENVKEAYQLVQTVDGKSTDIAVQIPVYKDSSLKGVELVDEDDKGKKGQFLKFTYITEKGVENVVYLDVSKFLVETEFKDGLVVSDAGEVSVKIDETSEDFLTVSDKGVKLSGVTDAIDAAKKSIVSSASTEYNDLAKVENKIKEIDAKASAAHTQVNAKADGHVTVAVETKTDASGITYSSVTVSEDDIASAKDLEDEITRAKGAEDAIGASVGLAEDGSHKATSGNYTSGATTVVGEIDALDKQVKKNADDIAALDAAKVSVTASDDTESVKYLEVSSTTDATTKATTYTVKAKGIDSAIKTTIEALDVAEVGKSGQFVQSIKEEDGKITAVAEDLTATNVAFTAIASDDKTMAVDATNVQDAVAALAKIAKTHEDTLTWIEV